MVATASSVTAVNNEVELRIYYLIISNRKVGGAAYLGLIRTALRLVITSCWRGDTQLDYVK